MIRSRKPREKKKKKKKEPSLSTSLPKWGSILPSEAKAMQVRPSQQGKSPWLHRCRGQFNSSRAGVILSVLSCMQVFCLHLSWWDLFDFPVLLRSLNFGGLSGLCYLQVDSWFPYVIPYMPNVPAKNDTPQVSPDPLCVWQTECLQSIWLESGGSSHSES